PSYPLSLHAALPISLELDEQSGDLRCVHPLLDRLTGVPEPVRRVSGEDLRLVCTARKMRFADAHTCALKAEAHVAGLDPRRTPLDRKSTRLNSSHVS